MALEPIRVSGVVKDLIEAFAQKAGVPEQAKIAELWVNWDLFIKLDGCATPVPLGHKGTMLIVGAEDSMASQDISYHKTEILARANSFMERDFFTSCRVLVAGEAKSVVPRKKAKGGGKIDAQVKGFVRLTGEGYRFLDPDSPGFLCYKAFVASSNGMTEEDVDAQFANLPPPSAEERLEWLKKLDPKPEKKPEPPVEKVKLTGEALAQMNPNCAGTRCYKAFALKSGAVIDEKQLKQSQDAAMERRRNEYLAGIRMSQEEQDRQKEKLPPLPGAADLTGDFLTEKNLDLETPEGKCYREFVLASRKRKGKD